MAGKKLRTRCDQLQRKIRALGPVFRGSLAQVHLTCGKSNCRCQKGRRHQAFYVSYRCAGKTKVYHVPAKLLPEVRQAHDNWLTLKALVEELADTQVALWKEKHREDKQAGPPTRATARGKGPRARVRRGAQ